MFTLSAPSLPTKRIVSSFTIALTTIRSDLTMEFNCGHPGCYSELNLEADPRDRFDVALPLYKKTYLVFELQDKKGHPLSQKTTALTYEISSNSGEAKTVAMGVACKKSQYWSDVSTEIQRAGTKNSCT